MLSFALFGVAIAGCGLPAAIDPAGECVTDANGFPLHPCLQAGERLQDRPDDRDAPRGADCIRWRVGAALPEGLVGNTTNEYEPFTFNMYGAKIPLPSFR